jgi:saccharopine dehydrogenase (NADP+, L-glutamate forming)
MKNVLVLGSGLVSKPLVTYLTERCGHDVTVATRTLEKANRTIGDKKNAFALKFDIEKDPNLKELVSQHDLVVSLLPYTHHVTVARAAIAEGIHMVTTSYVSDAMKELDKEAKDAGITLLNEIGLDPGIDHMEAMRIIHEVKEKGGSILEFISYCGGLPAPEANDNPFGYKFSWSPKGVVLASRNDAKFRKDGEDRVIPGKDLFANYEIVPIPGLGEFEGYPNRNSVPYADIYGIPEARTVLRGTLRNKGWCDTWKALHDIGILRDGPAEGDSYKDMVQSPVGGEGPLKDRIKGMIHTRNDDIAISNLEWLGLLSDTPLLDRTSKVDALSKLLESKLVYSPGERDMIVLQHVFMADIDGKKKEIRSTMIDYGIPNGDSAMSRTVGIPAAIGSDLLLQENGIPAGVLIPTIPEIYIPALERLEKEGIKFEK